MPNSPYAIRRCPSLHGRGTQVAGEGSKLLPVALLVISSSVHVANLAHASGLFSLGLAPSERPPETDDAILL
ncbi:hypothetical protein M5K25_002390 [Dendrobium thyrsiflorum]|uniref:Uncharacterized protein n=1 Tax=Dendrobium thyrsiflorum TaxID=117978 RepID=A0ABD0VUI8_DENTH